ncbi:hypothetical protein EXIGLDRAFT_728774, partial [Exidia glandulosa HHB12029]
MTTTRRILSDHRFIPGVVRYKEAVKRGVKKRRTGRSTSEDHARRKGLRSRGRRSSR